MGAAHVLLFLIQRTDCDHFTLAQDIDPAYAEAFAHAQQKGVEMLAYGCQITEQEITLAQELPISYCL